MSTARTGLYASLGLFLSCAVLEIVGAASVTIGPATSDNPTSPYMGLLGGILNISGATVPPPLLAWPTTSMPACSLSSRMTLSRTVW